MEPIQILEAIKEDIRDKFDGDPLMMRTMNLVITEYKARTTHEIFVNDINREIISKLDDKILDLEFQNGVLKRRLDFIVSLTSTK